MNRSFFLKTKYMIGVGFENLAHILVPKSKGVITQSKDVITPFEKQNNAFTTTLDSRN